MRRTWKPLLVLALLLVLAAWAAREALAWAIVVPARTERWKYFADRTPASLGLEGEKFWLESAPDIWLAGWFVRARTAGPPRGTVVLLHGSSSCKEALLGLSRELADAGWQSIAYDARAHGESGGRWITYGLRERADFSRVLDAAEVRFGPLGPVGVFGSSFGGATAIQAMAEDGRVRCAIVESAFADLRQTLREHGQLWFKLPPAVTDVCLARAAILAGFDPVQVCPAELAARARRPVLVVHGGADARIPPAHGERIFHALPPGSGSEWLLIPAGGHEMLAEAGGAAYAERRRQFLDRHCRPAP